MSREMKQSGYAWIGDIPQEWSLVPFGRLLNERNEKNNPVKSEERLSLSIELGVTLYSEKTTNLDRFKEDFSQYKLAHKGDLVMNSMNMIVGASGVSKYYGCVSPAYYTFYDNEENHITAKFCEYIFKSKPMMRLLHSLGKGIYAIDRGDDKVNTCRLKVAKHDLKNIEIPLPPIEEQYRIVQTINDMYLKMDSLIANQQKQIEKLKQYKQSLITEVVTKGLNPNVETKDSGVEWIEKIPSSWSVHTLKGAFSFSKGLPITKADLVENGTSVISYGQIHAKYNCSTHVDERLIRYVPDTFTETHPQCFVKKEDFIFADTSEDVAGSGDFIYIDTDKPIFAGYHTIVLKPKKEQKNRYLAYLFMSDMWKKQIQCRVSGVKLFSISRSILGKVTYILPSESEQNEIADFLEGKCKQIDRLISIKQQKIEKLNQYKKSIIYEYVTGKKEA